MTSPTKDHKITIFLDYNTANASNLLKAIGYCTSQRHNLF